jgi:hypothetical protein
MPQLPDFAKVIARPGRRRFVLAGFRPAMVGIGGSMSEKALTPGL